MTQRSTAQAGSLATSHVMGQQLYGLTQILETGALLWRGDTRCSALGNATAMGFSFSVDFGHNGRPSIPTARMGHPEETAMPNTTITCADGFELGAYEASPSGAAKGAVVVLSLIHI